MGNVRSETRNARWPGWAPPVAVFTIALTVRLAFMVAAQTYDFDSANDYWEAGYETGRIARHLAEGEGFSLELPPLRLVPAQRTAWLAPLYPALVAAVFHIFGSFNQSGLILILIFQITVSALSAVAIYEIGRRLPSVDVGLLAGLLFAVWPPAITFPAKIIWGTTLLTGFLLLLTLLLLRQRTSGSYRNAVGNGLVMGLLLLLEPAVAPLFPAVALILIARRGRRAITRVGTMALTATVVIAPWIWRNYTVFNEVFFIKSNFGHELFIGNTGSADGATRDYSGVAAVLTDDTRAATRTANEVSLSHALGRAAIARIGQQPGAFAARTARRVYLFWRLPLTEGWDKLPFSRIIRRWLGFGYECAQIAVVLLALVGAILGVRRNADFWIPVSVLIAYPLSFYVTHVGTARYRLPLLPFLLLLAALALAEGFRRIRNL